MGKGDFKIQPKDGTDITIAGVFFVPALFWNLLTRTTFRKEVQDQYPGWSMYHPKQQ